MNLAIIGAGLAVGSDTSAAETVAAAAPGAGVVAALLPFAERIDRGATSIGGVAPTVCVCGDKPENCETFTGLVPDIGAEPSMAGPLIMSRLVEPAMMLVVAQAYSGRAPRILGLRLLEK